MDELTIEDKKYLSSKKAAKLTGYAKDYVGQLCREGKVEARLVGRNWYVLEGSIMEHRFGAPHETIEKDSDVSNVSTSAAEHSNVAKNVTEYTWNPPVYTSEPYHSLPITPEPESVAYTPAESSPQVLNDMQSAWQEWFNTQKETKKTLPDASEMLLSIPEVSRSEEVEPLVEVQVVNIEEKSAPADPEDSYQTSSEEVPVFIKREVTSEPYISRNEYQEEEQRYTHREERQYRSEQAPHRAPRASQKPVKTDKAEKGTYLLKVTMLAVAGIMVAITYLAISSRDDAEMGNGNNLTNYFTGVHTIKTSR